MYLETDGDIRMGESAHKPYLADFKALQRELKRRGLYERDPQQVSIEIIAHILITIFGIGLFISFDAIAVKVIAMLILTLGLLGVGTHTHNSSHYASTNSRAVDSFLTYLGYSVILGFSALFWKYKHCSVHHSNPNILGVDEDIDLMPFFAVTDMDAKNAGRLGRFYYRYIQPLAFPFLISLTAFNIQRQAWVYLIRILRDPAQRRSQHWIDLACNVLHYVIWLAIPMLFFSPLAVLEFHVIKNVAIGYALFFMLGSSHLPEEALCAVEEQKNADFVLKQTAATVNIRTGRIGRFLMSGLDYQIEHHLLRGISYTRLPEANVLVKEYCQHNNYPHHTLGFLEASWKTIKVFYKPKPVQTELRKLNAVQGG